MTEKPDFIIFVDTSYFRDVPREQRADWERLLLFSKAQKVKIHIPYIAVEEWRTGKRDILIAKSLRAKSALKAFSKGSKEDFFKDDLNISLDPDFIPSPEVLEEASQKRAKKFIEENLIVVTEPAPEHTMRVWKKYFDWKPPFHSLVARERDDADRRQERRKHIPDAWIGEAAVDLIDNGNRVLCLCNDVNLTSLVKGAGVEVFTDAKDIIGQLGISEEIDSPVTAQAVPHQSISVTPLPPIAIALSPVLVNVTPVQTASPEALPSNAIAAPPNQLTQGTDFEIINVALTLLDQGERELQIRVLGYIHWLAPISKEELYKFLETKGHLRANIQNVAQRLTLGNFLRDTGNNYTPVNEEICGRAANLVMDEVSEVRDE
jgi:hypothetical protein